MRNRLKVFAALTLICALLCTACGGTSAEKKGSSGESGKGSASGTQEGKKPDVSASESDTEDSGRDETLPVSEPYADALYDRAALNGKMAVYFFGSDGSVTDSKGTQRRGGDAVLVIAPDGSTMLIDFSTGANSQYLLSSLKKLGVEKIDIAAVTMADMTHVEGYSLIMQSFPIGKLVTGGYNLPAEEMNELAKTYDRAKIGDRIYDRLLADAKSKGIQRQIVAEGDSFALGEVKVEVLNPPRGYADYSQSTDAWAGGSLLLKLTWKSASFLIGGDLLIKNEEEIAARLGSRLDADVIKINNHGYKTSNSLTWQDAVSAKVAVAEYGAEAADNPADSVIISYGSTGCVTLLTAQDGTVLVSTSGDGSYDVQVGRDRSSMLYGTLDAASGHIKVN